MDAAKKVVGRPFQPGDPRINRAGRRPGQSIEAMIHAEWTKPTAPDAKVSKGEMIVAMLFNRGQAGDIGAIREILDRGWGKSVARSESGEAGTFLDLEDVETEQLRKALKRVK